MGRLFDAVSSLAGVCHRVAYEAEAAMRFEELARDALDDCGAPYAFALRRHRDRRRAGDRGRRRRRAGRRRAPVIAARFHLAVADASGSAPRAVRARTGLDTVALSGGVFLNVLLTELCRAALGDAGFRVLHHRRCRPATPASPSASSSSARDIDRREQPMCLAVPGKVVEIWDDDTTRMAKVDFGGMLKEVCLEFVPDIEVGEYTIVHVGFALQRLDEQSALETLKLFESLGELDAEFGDAWVEAAREAGHGRGWTRDEVPRRVQRSGAGQAAARRHPRHRHPALGADGGLRRPDALDHPARHRPADPGRRSR